MIRKLGSELAKFHKTCESVSGVLPEWSKSMNNDLEHLLEILETEQGKFDHRGFEREIRQQVDTFFEETDKLDTDALNNIPVFVDWNIGNFSVTKDGSFFSRWDYDWFRMTSRIMDFYFFSRVCSDAGDKTIFSYLIDPLMEDRFLEFLEAYHGVFPLTRREVLLMKEAYRFFILNYVVKDGRYFFHEIYASRLQREAFTTYFPEIDKFNPDKIIRRLGL
jgi:Ser/Thr protein kinase RdoA (MazF antagonist)